jgi:hypothetical protein
MHFPELPRAAASGAMNPQQSIARYKIVSKLGEGGMVAVYRVTDTKLNRDVVIKVLPRFEREVQVLASLNHPHVAAVYSIEKGATFEPGILAPLFTVQTAGYFPYDIRPGGRFSSRSDRAEPACNERYQCRPELVRYSAGVIEIHVTGRANAGIRAMTETRRNVAFRDSQCILPAGSSIARCRIRLGREGVGPN